MLKYKIWILVCCIPFLAYAAPHTPVKATHGMVVSEQQLASQAGAQILQAGGNAIDAAVAVGYALAVVNPCCGNIGGGGFMTVRLANGKEFFLNFREKAPLAATEQMYLDSKGNYLPNKSTQGYLAVAVPGTVLGLETALKKYGTMTREEVMAPAIILARKGFILMSGDIYFLKKYADQFKKESNVASIFLKNNRPYQIGDRLIQTNLAATLKQIALKGPDVFYRGYIATDIVKASQKHGGILTMNDFNNYFVEELLPVRCTYRGYTIISSPPPSSGGTTLCEMLNILEAYPLKELGYHSAQGIHYIVEAMRYSFADRNNSLGDPDFVNNPVERLISKDYAAKIRKKIQRDRASTSENLPTLLHEGTNTTHYSVVDKFGNAVSVTYTINSYFGAEVIAGQTGFFLNNEMDDFAIKPSGVNQFGLVQGIANSIASGKRPLSSMTPTIVLKDNQVFMIVGSPGGPRIITATLETIINVIDYGMNIQEAVNAPRVHHQWLPDSMDIEPSALSPDTMKNLTRMGYHFTQGDTWSAVEAILIDPKTKILYGANDPRRPAGKAVGLTQ